MGSLDELVVAKKKLDESLGDNFKIYLQIMRQWFTQQLTKEEFDERVTQFLSNDSVMAHNRFLLALLNKCSNLVDIEDIRPPEPMNIAPTPLKIAPKTEVKAKPPVIKPLKKKLKALKDIELVLGFEPSPKLENSYLRSIKKLDDCNKVSKVTYCRREYVLPDYFMSHLRVLVIAWEIGLDGVQDNAVKLCNAALRDFIKMILTEIFASRSAYRLRDNRFKYCIGGPPLNPYLKNSYSLLQMPDQTQTFTFPETGESHTIRPTIDSATNNAMYWMACGGKQSNGKRTLIDEPINLRHLVDCIKTNHNLIPNYSVRCNAFYKTVTKLAELEPNSTND